MCYRNRLEQLLGLVRGRSTQDHCPCVQNAAITTKDHVLPNVISVRRSAIWLVTVGVLVPKVIITIMGTPKQLRMLALAMIKVIQGHFKKITARSLRIETRVIKVRNGNAPDKRSVVGNARNKPRIQRRYGHHVFLAHVTTKETEDKSREKRIEDVPIVRDFLEVFLEDLRSSTDSKSGIPYRFDTWCCTCNTSTLSIGSFRNERVIRATARAIRQGLYKTDDIK
ncbi:hypothetical protein Tco_1210522 [Tanacetum coccineum]